MNWSALIMTLGGCLLALPAWADGVTLADPQARSPQQTRGVTLADGQRAAPTKERAAGTVLFSVQDAPLQEVLETFREQAGVQIVYRGPARTVSLRLTAPLPWNEALELVCQFSNTHVETNHWGELVLQDRWNPQDLGDLRLEGQIEPKARDRRAGSVKASARRGRISVTGSQRVRVHRANEARRRVQPRRVRPRQVQRRVQPRRVQPQRVRPVRPRRVQPRRVQPRRVQPVRPRRVQPRRVQEWRAGQQVPQQRVQPRRVQPRRP